MSGIIVYRVDHVGVFWIAMVGGFVGRFPDCEWLKDNEFSYCIRNSFVCRPDNICQWQTDIMFYEVFTN